MSADRTLSLLVKFAALDRLTGATRSMLGGTRNLKRGLAETRQELTALRRSEASLAAFRGLENKLRGTAEKLELARQRTAALKTEQESAGNTTKKMAAAMARAERDESRLTDRHEEQGRELQQLVAKLEAAGMKVEDLGNHEERLAESIRAANRRLEEQKDHLERNEAARARVDRARERGERMRERGYGMIATGAIVGAPLLAAGQSAATLESRMTDIAQKADITRVRAAAIGREFDRMGPAVAQLPMNLAEGVDTLLGLGSSLPNAMAAIEPIGRAATAYHAEVNDLAEASYASLQNLGVRARETGRTLDVMARAGKSGAFELRDMAQYFPQLTASAQALGQRGVPAVADLAAALQITRRATGDAATAANNLQNLMNKINTRDTIANFRTFGIDLRAELQRAARMGKSPIEAIAELTNRALGGDMSRLSFLFGDAQVQAALRPLVQNLADYRRIRADALAATGTVEADFNERMRDSAEIYNQNMSRLQALGHVVGRALLPTFNSFMTTVGALADRFSAWATAHPELAALLAKIVAYGAILLIILGGLAVAIGTILGPFAYLRFMLGGALPVLARVGGAIRFVSRAVLWLGRALLMNPIGLAITALAAAAYLVWNYWSEIKAAFWAALGWLGGVVGAIGSFMGRIFYWLTWPLRKAWQGIVAAWNGIKAAFEQAFAFIQRVTQAGINALTYFFRPLILLLRGDFRGAANAAMDMSRSMVNGIVSAFSYLFPGVAAQLGVAWAGIRSWFAGIFAWFGSLPGRFMEFGRQMINGLVNGLTAGLGRVRDRILGLGRSISGWFRSTLGINSPSRVFAEYGGFIAQGLAQGIDRGGREPVERIAGLGRRLTAAIALGAAAPALAATAPGAGGSGAGGARGNTYHFHIAQQPGQSAQDLARAIADEIDRRERAASAAQRSSYDDD